MLGDFHVDRQYVYDVGMSSASGKIDFYSC